MKIPYKKLVISKCIMIGFILLTFLPNLLLAASPVEHVVNHPQITVKGQVTSADDGLPLPIVNILLKGTTKGTQTDFDGNYSIEVPDQNAVLVFSFMGYLTQEVSVSEGTTINVSLKSDVTSLDEVVVVGYGTMKKQDVTGAVSSVEAKDIVSTPVPGVADAIKGKIAGVDITNSNGNPGSGQQIRIRGNRSITASNAPLVVLDGIPYAGFINDINPNDIQSIEVLKDASSTAIYGSRGANGVILITTKRGATGGTKVTFDSYYGPTEMYGEIDARNAEQYVQQRIDVAKFYNNHTTDRDVFQDWEWEAIQNGVDTDWMDFVFRQGHRQNHQLSISGGNDKTQFLVSAGFFDEKAIIQKGDYKRYTFRLNLDHKVND